MAAWNSHDAQRVAEFFAEDAVYDDHGAGTSASGRDEILAHAARVLTAFPDLNFELTRSCQGPDYILGEWRAEMTHQGELFGLAATGRRLSSEGVDVARFDEDDRVTRLVSYYDGASVMRQLGLLPARASRAERLLIRAVSLLPGR